ncbi:MAG: hypothetical protein HYX79_08570 [Chloroflexi bacterium]|nr:hypothetical protein [Chloroflexota bacterium]
MTDEELKQELESASEELKNLTEREKSLTKPERKRRTFLRMKMLVLERLRDARAKNDRNAEFSQTMNYGLLTTLGEKHPFLMMFMKSKMTVHL